MMAAVLLAASCAADAASGRSAAPPHIVMILGDDIGAGDVGWADPEVISPTLDELATSGVRLGRMYSYMWCAPSRAALLTGRYPQHTGVYYMSGAGYALDERFRLLPQMLAAANYTSHAVGKWHLGMAAQKYLPEARGFSSYLGYLNGGEDYYKHDNSAAEALHSSIHGSSSSSSSGSSSGGGERSGEMTPATTYASTGPPRREPACTMHQRQGAGCTDKTAPGVRALGFATAANSTGCCAACSARAGCGAWTYRPIPHNNCLLANRASPPRETQPGMACGSVAPMPPPAPVTGCYYRDFWNSTVSRRGTDDGNSSSSGGGGGGGGGYGGGGGPATDPRDFPRYSTYVFAERAVSVVNAHEAASGPLFLYLPFQSAHTPLEVPEPYLQRYKSYKACAPWRRGSGYACGGPGGGLYCPCSRMLMSAMVTALDDAVANVTAAVKAKGMWDNTVLVFAGDNGGPQSRSHWNAGLRGGKWTFFEGGIRPAAFVTSPLLPATARGSLYNGTVHLVDWAATFLGLAGLAADPGLDGVDQWEAISSAGEGAPLPSPRNETLITAGVVVAGKWKLATVALGGFGECGVLGRQGWDCLLGTNGGWLPELPAGDVGGNVNLCPTVPCANVTPGGVDAWLCGGQCSVDKPCLYDLASDPQERTNLAPVLPGVVAELTAVLGRLNATVVPPYAKLNGTVAEQCEAYETRWGVGGVPYFGPWLPERPKGLR